MRVVSFYTPGTRYEIDAAQLRKSCTRFAIPCEMHAIVRDAGAPNEWVRAVGQKPFFIREMLLAHKSPVCWMDADCTILQDPLLLRTTRAELGIYNFFADPMLETGEYAPHRLWAASGVVYLAFTPRIMRLVNEWCALMEEAPWMIDDQALSWAFNHFKGGKISVLWLPRAYNRMSGKWPGVEPVIDHAWQPRSE